MEYSFDVDIAKEYGINEAIMIRNFQFWIAKNKANEKHYHDGRTWTYNTVQALQSLFPFWTKKQIWGTLDRLKKKNVLISANYNTHNWDRTLWYAFVDEDKWFKSFIFPKGKRQFTQRETSIYPEVTPIPDNKPYIKPNIESTDTKREINTHRDNNRSLLVESKDKPIAFDSENYEFLNITEEQIKKWEDTYPAVNIRQAIKSSACYFQANPKKIKKNWARFLVNRFSWLQDHPPRQNEYRHNLPHTTMAPTSQELGHEPEKWGRSMDDILKERELQKQKLNGGTS